MSVEVQARQPIRARVNVLPAISAGAAIVVLIALPALGAKLNMPAIVGLATQVLIYSIAALSLNLILGYGGMVSFGHAAFFGLGGYVVGILYQHFTEDTRFLNIVPGTDFLLVAIPIAMLVCGIVAALIGALSLRTSGAQFIMITLAFAQMLYYLFISLQKYGGDDGLIMRRRDTLPLLTTSDDTVFYFICLATAAFWFVIIACISRSRFGFVLGGIRQNERRLAASGLSPFRYKLVAFVISAMGTGLAGGFLANYLRFVSPDMLHWTKSGDLIMMVVLGGIGRLTGPLFGATVLVLLEACLAAYTENWQLYLGIVLLGVVLYGPGGLHALIDRIRDKE